MLGLFRRGSNPPVPDQAVHGCPETPGKIIPRDLGMLGQATSDSGYLVLEAIAAVQGPRFAADAAAGYADAFARFALRHPDAFD